MKPKTSMIVTVLLFSLASGVAWSAEDKLAAPADVVTVHYTGLETDGKMFDSSVERGKPSTFRLDRVIKGWTEGLQLMVVGEKRRFWIPENLAYGKHGRIPGMLVFDVEMFGFK